MGLYPPTLYPDHCPWWWHLGVREQKGDGQVLHASLEQDLFDIFAPLSHAIALGQLNLEALVLGPGDELGRGVTKLGTKC